MAWILTLYIPEETLTSTRPTLSLARIFFFYWLFFVKEELAIIIFRTGTRVKGSPKGEREERYGSQSNSAYTDADRLKNLKYIFHNFKW
jgi:hypothetical protein